jgi:hypothetical protein
MKKLITLCLILLGVVAQAQTQVTWGDEGFRLMEQSFRIVGYPVTTAVIRNEIIKMDKNSFKPNGKEECLRLNIYYDYSRLGKRFDLAEGHYLVTVDVVWGNAPTGIVHPKSGKYLVSSSYVVPQDLTPTYEFYRPTEAQRKKMTPKDRALVGDGVLFMRKVTASTKQKLGKRK